MRASGIAKAIAIAFGLWVGSYAVLCVCGREKPRLVISGKYHWAGGLGLSDTVVWNPALLEVSYRRGSGAPRIYSPLIWLDHRFWHKSRSIFD